jgi:gluconolactonase
MGILLNSPNDIAVRADGTIYFTDPPYGIDPADQDLDFNGLFRVDPGGALTAEWRGALDTRPNGVALSPDQRTLYLADTTAGLTAFAVQVDGSLSDERPFVPSVPNADGLAVDTGGNVYVAAADGVRVYAPDGSLWGTIAVPRQPANAAFGEPDARTLYITARQGLYRVRLTHPGIW